MIGDHLLVVRLLEHAQLNLQRRRTGHRAGTHAEQDVSSGSLFSGRIAQLDESVCQPFQGGLGDVGVVVPDDAGTRGSRDGRTQLGMVVAPQHLIVTRRAVEVQLALLREIEQASSHQQIVARSLLVSAVGILEGRTCRSDETSGSGESCGRPVATMQADRATPGSRRPACMAAAMSAPDGPRMVPNDRRVFISAYQPIVLWSRPVPLFACQSSVRPASVHPGCRSPELEPDHVSVQRRHRADEEAPPQEEVSQSPISLALRLRQLRHRP